jgi:hypothetical protein
MHARVAVAGQDYSYPADKQVALRAAACGGYIYNAISHWCEIDIYVEACLAQVLRVDVETVFTHGLSEKRAT